MDGVKLIFNALLGLALFCGILYLAYLSTRYIGKKYGYNGKGSGNLTIVDSISLGRDGKICIVRAGEKYLLVGITQQNISLISELDSSQLEFDRKNNQGGETMSFSEALKINLQKKFGKENKENTENTENPEKEEATDNDTKDGN